MNPSYLAKIKKGKSRVEIGAGRATSSQKEKIKRFLKF